MGFYKANIEFIKMKEVFKGESEWEKAFALFHCLTLRDRKTAEHSIEVAYYAAKIAERLDLDASRYFLGGLLHDIGKIHMNDHPLKSSDRLTKTEYAQLKDHVLHGVLTLSELGFSKDIVQFCLRHHERMDGSGYPFGVDNEVISIEGNIAMIADVFSALTNSRMYRDSHKSYSYDRALELMKRDRDKFDYNILTIFEEIITKDKQHCALEA